MEGEKTAAQAVEMAAAAWERAPIHVKAMAGAYVGPMLAALRALAEEVEQIKGKSDENF